MIRHLLRKRKPALYKKLDLEQVTTCIREFGTTLNPDTPAPTFFIGTGRCGTHFFYELFNQNKKLHVMHESMLLQDVDSFNRYSQWNNLDIDQSLFFDYRNALINQCAAQGKTYVESNTYCSLSVQELYQAYSSKFILTLRDPIDVVRSMCNKNWYQTIPMKHKEGALGFQLYGLDKINHYFGRIVPIEQEKFEQWLALTQVGKISWFVNELNLAILDQFEKLPQQNFKIIYIEKFDYRSYLNMNSFIDEQGSPISENAFLSLHESRPGNLNKNKTPWSEKEKEEFNNQTKALQKRLDFINNRSLRPN